MKTYIQFNEETSVITVYIMVGIQGCGKSTWIKKNKLKLGDYIVINLDTYRKDFEKEKQQTDSSWKFKHDDQESQMQVVKKGENNISQAIKDKKNIVLDTMNIKKRYRTQSIKSITDQAQRQNIGVKFIAIYFPPNPEESIKRIKVGRKTTDINFVPEDIVRKRAETISPPTKEEGYEQIITVKY